MIRLQIWLDQDGSIAELESTGHAEAGNDLGCGIVSAVLKSMGLALSRRSTIGISGSAGQPGEFRLVCSPREKGDQEWYAGLSDLVLTQLDQVQREFPRSLEMEIHKETYHGSQKRWR